MKEEPLIAQLVSLVDLKGLLAFSDDCPNWGKHGDMYRGCRNCVHCWLASNRLDLENMLQHPLVALGTEYALVMNGEHEGEYVKLGLPTDWSHLVSNGQFVCLNAGDEREVFLMAATTEQALGQTH